MVALPRYKRSTKARWAVPTTSMPQGVGEWPSGLFIWVPRMYGKLFEQMYDGTLADHWEALITFQQLIILCDSDGIVDMTPTSIARRTGIPVDIIETGIAVLCKPDADSRTPDEEGRRLTPLDEHRDWGWRIVNHRKYRDLHTKSEQRSKAAERQKRWRDKKRNDALRVTQNNDIQIADTNRDKKKKEEPPKPPKGDYSDDFQRFWSAFPRGRKGAKGNAWKAWKAAIKVATAETIIAAALEYAASDVGQGEYVKGPAPWLNGRCWEDDREAWSEKGKSHTFLRSGGRGDRPSVTTRAKRKAKQ